MVRTLAPLMSLLVLAACNPKVFRELENAASTVAIEKPSVFDPDLFGSTLAVVRGELANGADSSRIAIGGGPDTPTFTYDIWNDVELGTFSIQSNICDEPIGCSPGTGTALAGAAQMGTTGETCVVIGEPGLNQIRYHCGTDNIDVQVGGTGNRFGAALAAVPFDVAVATRAQMIIGAPGAAGDDGGIHFFHGIGNSVFRLDGASTDVEVVPAGAQLGAQLATAALPAAFAGTTLQNGFLVAALQAGTGRVVLYQVGAAQGSMFPEGAQAEVLGCIDAPLNAEAGFGVALAAGDVIGNDGIPEVYAGYRLGAVDHNDTVLAYDLAELTPGAGCGRATDDDALTPIAIACPTGPVDSGACTESSFGSAITVGDIDGDGAADLIVGAPDLSVDDKASAGGIFAIAGGGATLSPAGAALMTHSRPDAEDRLGTAVAAIPSHINVTGVRERAEVVGGAPGRDAAYVFLCSGLGDDDIAFAPRCIEESPYP